MKPTTHDEKRELIDYCIGLGVELERVTDEELKVHIGWIRDGCVDIKVYLMLNDYGYWFCGGDGHPIRIDIPISKFESYDGVYLELNRLVEMAHQK